jgi:hypothetical protein
MHRPRVSRHRTRPLTVLDRGELGQRQALILKKLDDLGDEGYGHNVIEQLSLDIGVRLDRSQIYTGIRKLLQKAFSLHQLGGLLSAVSPTKVSS